MCDPTRNPFARRCVIVACFASGPLASLAQLPTTLDDFFLPGSQPSAAVYEPFVGSNNCRTCHNMDGATDLLIHSQWQGSMMAHSARDPLFYACLAIANQDAAFAGDLCLRCHTPGGWISGRSTPTSGAALTSGDRDGVSCSACHRMVDPVYKPGISPPYDATILSNIDPLPSSPGGGNYVLDPLDIRRGPYTDAANPSHSWLPSPFHRTAELCATCHDVSNPLYERLEDDTYTLSSNGAEHPTGDKYDMFPIERTYSEWLHSAFADGGVDLGGRFGGNQPVVSTCQDCHMPKTAGEGCNVPGAPVRPDLAAHELSGANAWVLQLVLNLYPSDNINAANIQAGRQRAISMLQRAASLQLSQVGNRVMARVINETGHKLPSGYPEGRRMWLHFRAFDAGGAMIGEVGHYEPATAELSVEEAKVYEAVMGVDQPVADMTGIPVGPGFHFALSNVIYKDNRIPPRGFTNAAYAQVQAAPVGAHYADGQYWDDTVYRLPARAARVEASLHYQTASKEYITFLRDENHTNNAGQVLYDQWLATDKCPPVLMIGSDIVLHGFVLGDPDGDTDVDLVDGAALASCLAGPDLSPPHAICSEFDYDADGDVDAADAAEFQIGFTGVTLASCLSGPQAEYGDAECVTFDADVDADVDLTDFSELQIIGG